MEFEGTPECDDPAESRDTPGVSDCGAAVFGAAAAPTPSVFENSSFRSVFIEGAGSSALGLLELQPICVAAGGNGR